MRLSRRRSKLTIKQWVRDIGTSKYKFIVTYYHSGRVTFQVWQRKANARYEAEIHRWTVDPNGEISGVYRRSNK